MSTLNAISTAVTKSLLSTLPAAMATEFSVSEDKAREFLQGFLSSQLGKVSANRKNSTPKGTNGKGRISGYILFSNEHRPSVNKSQPDLKFTEVGKRLGEMWGKLSDSQKQEWNARAVSQNAANGLTPAPSAGPAKTPRAPVSTPATPASATRVVRHEASKAFVYEGTTYAVHSQKNPQVVGRVRGAKVVALSPTDRKHCQEQGWAVREVPAASASSAPVKQVRKAKPAEHSDEE
jgi:hypothetical protein